MEFGSLVDVDFGSLESFEPIAELKVEDLPAEAQPTSFAEVHRVLFELNPKPNETFVDFGCGHDARFCIAASSIYGCDSIGIEIDPERAASARRRVRELGLTDKVEIIEGDATAVDVDADVGVAYLWPNVLEKLKPKLENLDRFASIQHRVPGLEMAASGDSFFWERPKEIAAVQTVSIPFPEYSGYQRPVCNKANCSMCNKIRANMAARSKTTEPEPKKQSSGGYWKTYYCNGKVCRRVWIPGT